MKSDNVKIELDLLPINPKKQRKEPEAEDFADEYVIAIRRNDGKGVSPDEAHQVMMAWMMNRNFARRRNRS